MPWVKIDDHFDEHPKHAALGPLEWGVWLAGLSYSNRNLTDGFIPRNKAHTLCSLDFVNGRDIWTLARIGEGTERVPMDLSIVIKSLVKVGLWDEVRGGYQIHDFQDYQPSCEAVLREREAARERKAKSRGVSQNGSRSESQIMSQEESHRDVQAGHNPPVPVPVPVPKAETSNKSKPRKTTVKRGARSKPKTHITDDWEPDQKVKDAMLAEVPGLDLADTINDFRDYYQAKGEPQADWNARFRRWCRNQKRWAKEQGQVEDDDDPNYPKDKIR